MMMTCILFRLLYCGGLTTLQENVTMVSVLCFELVEKRWSLIHDYTVSINQLNFSISNSATHYRPTQSSIPPGSVNEYQLRLGRQRQVWFIPLADERGVCTGIGTGSLNQLWWWDARTADIYFSIIIIIIMSLSAMSHRVTLKTSY